MAKIKQTARKNNLYRGLGDWSSAAGGPVAADDDARDPTRGESIIPDDNTSSDVAQKHHHDTSPFTAISPVSPLLKPPRVTRSAPPPPPAAKTKSTFSNTKQTEHTALKSHIDKTVQKNQSKYATWSSRERWMFIQRERFVKLREREKKGSGTMRKLFPDAYDEEKEVGWLWKAYESQFVGGEDVRWVIVVDEKDESEDDEDREREEDDRDDDEEMVDMKVKTEGTEGNTKETVASGPAFDESVQRDCEAGDENDLRRMWRWQNGSLTIWPPTKDPEQSELEREILRAARLRNARQALRRSGHIVLPDELI